MEFDASAVMGRERTSGRLSQTDEPSVSIAVSLVSWRRSDNTEAGPTTHRVGLAAVRDLARRNPEVNALRGVVELLDQLSLYLRRAKAEG